MVEEIEMALPPHVPTQAPPDGTKPVATAKSEAGIAGPAAGSPGKPPSGYRWRSSVWYITLIVGIGIATDLGIYSVIIPVVPFRLQSLGYTEVSVKTSWLLLAYSLSLVLSTPPVVWASEKLGGRRRTPLLAGIVFLAGSVVMFMLAPNYATLVIARILQGISGSVIWVVGLALLCDTVPEERVGQQLGLAMTGVTIGFSAGPPLGGLLYQKLGFRAPFVFCLCLTALDFIGRIIVIEPRDVRQWTEADAEALSQTGNVADVEKQHSASNSPRLPPAPALVVSDPDMVEVSAPEEKGNSSDVPKTSSKAEEADAEKVDQLPLASTEIVEISKPLSYLEATWQILKSGRGMAALVNTLLYGVLMTSLEPTFTLRLQAVWNLSSLRVGLIYLAGAVPAFFSGAIAGWSADVYGAEWATTICLLLSFPWYMLLIIKGHLAFFIVCFCLAMFLLNGMVSPATSELAAVSRNLPGVTYAHVFGGFNMCYSIGSAIGPIIGGQVYDGVKNGWVVLMIINTCIISCCAMVTLALTGNDPILQRIARSLRRSRIDSD